MERASPNGEGVTNGEVVTDLSWGVIRSNEPHRIVSQPLSK